MPYTMFNNGMGKNCNKQLTITAQRYHLYFPERSPRSTETMFQVLKMAGEYNWHYSFSLYLVICSRIYSPDLDEP